MTVFDVRVLSVRQPWAACLVSGRKDIENRTRNVKYRGLVAIHSSLRGDADAESDRAMRIRIGEAIDTLPGRYHGFGVVLAVAELTDAHPFSQGCCDSPWAEEHASVWHWRFANVQRLVTPIPAKGRLGLWIPDAGLTAQIRAQLEVD